MSGAARGYSWPAATPGNTIAVRHGANSVKAIAAVAAELRPRLFDIATHLDPVLDVIAVDRFLRCEARSLMLDNYLIEMVDQEASAKLVSVHEQATAASRLAAHLGTTLGLDYRSRMQLRRTEASTEALEDVIEAGRRARLGGPDVIDADPVSEQEIEA